MELLSSLALLSAVAVWGARRLKHARAARAREHALAARDGTSPERPLKVASFHELDDAVETFRCPCGGPLERVGEGARPGVRVVRCECVVCEEDVDLFFDLAELRH